MYQMQGIDHYFCFVVMDHYNYIQINVVKHHYFTTFLKWQSSGTTSLHHYFSFISWGFWRATKWMLQQYCQNMPFFIGENEESLKFFEK